MNMLITYFKELLKKLHAAKYDKLLLPNTPFE